MKRIKVKEMEYPGKITIAIAEDEIPVRRVLASYLESFSQVEVAAALSNGEELLRFMEASQVTAVFLDVEMPGLDGLTTAATIKRHHPDVFIVFVTAHTQYAAESYQFDAVDYLVKPVSRDAIARAIKKIEKFLSLNVNSNSSIKENRILLKNDHELYLINPLEVFYAEKQLKKTVIHSVNGKYVTTEPLHALENKFGNNFFRCHKSFLINLDRVQKITPIADRLYEVSFYNYPEKVTMRRHKFEELCTIITGKSSRE